MSREGIAEKLYIDNTMQIIGIKVNDGFPSVIKNLKRGGWYPFGDYNEPSEENGWTWRKDDDEKLLSQVYKEASDEPFPNNLKISVSCIVGQNGSGKTTLLELMFRIINNFAFVVIDKKRSEEEKERYVQTGRQLCEASGFSASLYFETDGNLGIVKYDYGRVGFRYLNDKTHSLLEEKFQDKFITDSKRKKILAGFFYTICTNYSIHSFCQEDYDSASLLNPHGENGVSGQWVRGILHKNDGYLAPLVVVPYRDEWGNIDVSNEKDLAEQRLATLGLLFWSQKKCFMDKYKPAYLEYRFDEKSTFRYANKLVGICNERLPLNRKDQKEMLSQFSQVWHKRLSDMFPDYLDYGQEIANAIGAYLAYKSIKICLNYPSFGELLGLRHLTYDEIEDVRKLWEEDLRKNRTLKEEDIKYMSVAELPDGCYEKVVDAVLSEEEHTHITLKIRQVLEFLKRGLYGVTYAPVDSEEYQISVKKMSADVFITKHLSINNENLSQENRKNRFLTYDEVYVLLPPSIFQWHLYFLPKHEKLNETMDNGMLLGKMSSGEKQILQSASYLLYHIKNIENIREDRNRKAYHHINLVLDEAELYYHPEMQRTMIANIVKMLSWCHINNTKIRSVHLMVVTHSPFVLSDVPKNRILYLKEGEVEMKGNQTFAANVHDLLYNQFFIQNSIGEVAWASVREIIDVYRNESGLSEKEKQRFFDKYDYYRHFLNLIGEKYLKNTLSEMLETILERENNDRMLWVEHERLKQRLEEIERKLEEKYNEKN